METRKLEVPDMSPNEIGVKMINEVKRFSLEMPKEVSDVAWDYLMYYLRLQRDCHMRGWDSLIELAEKTREMDDRIRDSQKHVGANGDCEPAKDAQD